MTKAKTKETTQKELAADFMFSELHDALLTEIKEMKTPWAITPQQGQEEIIERIDKRLRVLVYQCAEKLADAEHKKVLGRLDQISVKKEMKAIVLVDKEAENRHELFDRVGNQVVVSILDVEQFMGEREDRIKSDDDNMGLDLL